MAIVPLTKSKTEFVWSFHYTSGSGAVRRLLLRCRKTKLWPHRWTELRDQSVTPGVSRQRNRGFLVLVCSRWVLSWCSCDRRRPLGNLRMTLSARWCWSKVARIYIFCALWCADFSELQRM